MKKHSFLWLVVVSTGLLVSCGGNPASSSVASSASTEKSSIPSSSSIASSRSSAISSAASSSATSSSSMTSSSETLTLTSKVVDCYYMLPSVKQPLTVYFQAAAPDLAFLKMDASTFDFLQIALGYQQSLTVGVNQEQVSITTLKGDVAVIDFINQVITYDNYDAFYTKKTALSPLDPVASSGKDAQGQAAYLERESDSSFYLEGDKEAVTIDLGAHEIPMIFEGGAGYLPFATFSDIFLGPTSGNLAFNGQAAFYIADFSLFSDLYYLPTPTQSVSEPLATFNYNELCLCFDYSYGLYEKRGVTSFDGYFERMGYKNDMLSTNTLTSETATEKAMFHGFDEAHSGFTNASAYSGKSFQPLQESFYGPSIASHFAIGKTYSLARNAAYPEATYPDGIPGYEEIGDTAYVTFDQFKSNQADYYTNPVSAVTKDSDTFAIVEYAHSQIMRTGSPITQVVLDLSCNGGGEVDALAYIAGWMLGTAPLSLVNPRTGSKGTTIFRSDVNLDRQFDDNDTLGSKKIYCLISENSFSCGNLLPFILKASDRVTLLGQNSGGGACEIQHISSAIGAVGQFSGHFVISTVKNGIYSDVDDGVAPHYYLNDPAEYYNRTALSTYLDTLK
jgi:hypothetical protein